ncbi:MAG: BrnT family toxin [Alphaproteobacteria bacterium]|nr:MAG: BrnT family toxin [Alphaproteobacteria bacterium]TAF75314.1 MAG: BrnT family toxin [Alphaproteobacteria bacterium]
MQLEWDHSKNEANSIKHGIAFEDAYEFNFSTAKINVDDRSAYGEIRYEAQGFIGARLHIMIFTMRGAHIRIISLRKSNKREQRSYYAE